MAPGKVVIRKAALLTALALSACGDAGDDRRAALCAAVIPALTESKAAAVIVRRDTRPNAVRLFYDDGTSGSQRWLECRFNPPEMGDPVLSGVTLDRGGRQSEITVMLLRAFWLERDGRGTAR